ncbi:MAG: CBS domain-containing protein [Oscillospiraceae bacterium]|nr:CBS domain-containing protein [Oscillospiraceae bacterium]
MDNILFFLTPKALCSHLMADDTLRQALVRMESAKYQALPILNKKGEYCGTLTEGDALWALMNRCGLDIHKAEHIRIMDIAHRKDNTPVKVDAGMEHLLERAAKQNFIPVVDDKNTFIGIITRRSIIKYCQQQLLECRNAT